MIAKDIVADEFENTSKRVTTNRDLKYLRGLVQDSDHRWKYLVATAAFRAEEQRAPFPLDIATATTGFERNPFRWQVEETKRSHAEVAFLWKWTSGLDAEEQQKRAIVTPRLNNILVRGQVPSPPGMCQMDSENYRRFLAIAETETREHKAPCVYLGLETEPGKYEPDPSNWPSSVHDSKTKANVWYEWQHVRCNGLSHASHTTPTTYYIMVEVPR